MYIFKKNILCLYIKYIYINKLYEYKYIHVNTCKYILYVCVFIYILYIINIDSTHTYIMYTKTFILDVINRD